MPSYGNGELFMSIYLLRRVVRGHPEAMEFGTQHTLQQVLPMCPWSRQCAGVLLRDAWQKKGPLAVPWPCLM